MAISWGAWEYSGGNGMRVGIDVDASSVSHSSSSVQWTVRYYTENQYSYNDGQTLNFGGSYSAADVNFTNNDGGAVIHRATKNFGYTYSNYGSSPGQRTFTVSLSGAFNGVTPSKSVTVNIPARPIAAPLPQFNVNATRINDDRVDTTWSRQIPGDGSRPYESQTVQAQSYYDGWSGWSTWTTVGSGSTSYGKTGLIANRAYQTRVRANNDAGSSAYTSSDVVYMTPTSPDSLAISSGSPTSRTLTWNRIAYGASSVSHQIQRSINGGAWTTEASVSAKTETWTDPDTIVGYVRYQIRAFVSVGSLADDWRVSPYFYSTPSAPTGAAVAVDPGNGDRTITWTSNAYNEASVRHEVQRSINGGTWTTITSSLLWNDTSYEDTSLQTGVVQYRVRAFRGSYYSGYSTTAAVSLSTIVGKHQVSWNGTKGLSRSVDTHLGMWALIDLDKPTVRYILPAPDSTNGYAAGKDSIDSRMLLTEVPAANTVQVTATDLGGPAADETDAPISSTYTVTGVTGVSAGRAFGGFKDQADEAGGTQRLYLGLEGQGTGTYVFDSATSSSFAQNSAAALRNFPWANGAVGYDWDGTNFWSLGPAGNVYKHTTHMWDSTTLGSYIQAAYTSRDETNSYETPLGKVAVATGKKRAKIVITTGNVATFGGVTTNRIYVAFDTNTTPETNLANWHLQGSAGTPGLIGTLTLDTINQAGANPSSTNTFPEANPGEVKSAVSSFGDNIIRLSGDGGYSLGSLGNSANTRETYVLNGFHFRSAASDVSGGLWRLSGDGSIRMGDTTVGTDKIIRGGARLQASVVTFRSAASSSAPGVILGTEATPTVWTNTVMRGITYNSATGTWTVAYTGAYLLHAKVTWAADTVTDFGCGLQIWKNGAQWGGIGVIGLHSKVLGNSTGIQMTVPVDIVAGDQLQMSAWQGSGAAKTPNLVLFYLSPVLS